MASKRQRSRWFYVGVGAAALAVLAAVAGGAYALAGSDDTPAVAAAPTPSYERPTTGPIPTVSDPRGKFACDEVHKAVAGQGADTVDPAAIMAIADAAMESRHRDLQFWGTMLRSQAVIASHAQGARDETARKIKLMAGAMELATACIKVGYTRP